MISPYNLPPRAYMAIVHVPFREQVALAVDHAGLVKKWAMAVKKLLLTAQSHSSKDAPANPNPSPTPPPYFQPSSANGS